MRRLTVFAALVFATIAHAQAPYVPGQNPPQPPTPPPATPEAAPQLQPAGPPSHIALRVVGSHVRNSGGERLGRIEEVLVNRTNHNIAFAVLAPHFPTNESRLVPIPWSLLTYAWDQSRAGGPAGANQVFIANIDPSRLANAPSLDRNRLAALDPILYASENYFGTDAAGGTGSGSGSVSGSGAGAGAARGTTASAPGGVVSGSARPVTDGSATAPNQPAYVPGFGYPGVVLVTTNTTVVPIPGTNNPPANTNAPPGNTNAPPGNTNAPPGNTNAPPGNTNAPPPNTNTNNASGIQPGASPPYAPRTNGIRRPDSQPQRVDPGPDANSRQFDFPPPQREPQPRNVPNNAPRSAPAAPGGSGTGR